MSRSSSVRLLGSQADGGERKRPSGARVRFRPERVQRDRDSGRLRCALLRTLFRCRHRSASPRRCYPGWQGRRPKATPFWPLDRSTPHEPEGPIDVSAGRISSTGKNSSDQASDPESRDSEQRPRPCWVMRPSASEAKLIPTVDRSSSHPAHQRRGGGRRSVTLCHAARITVRRGKLVGQKGAG